MSIVLMVLTLAVLIALDLVYAKRRALEAQPRPAMIPAMMELPALPPATFVAKTHSYARFIDDREFKLGIDGLLAEALGHIDAVELPSLGTLVSRGQPLAVLHIGDKSIQLHAPFDGTITAQNPLVSTHAEAVTDDPYDSGWLVQIAPADQKQALEPLLSGNSAQSFLTREYRRLVDALVRAVSPNVPALADGAQVERGAVGRLEQWALSDFETHFLR